MALVYSKRQLSGSVNGLPVRIDAVASPGDTVHTVQSTGTEAWESMYLWANLSDTATGATRTIVLEFGGTSTEDEIRMNVTPNDGATGITFGWPLMATTTIVRAWATATGLMNIMGYVNRAT